MLKLTRVRQQVKECIASGVVKPDDISKEIGYSPNYVRQVMGVMIRDNELERAKVNGKSVIGFGLGQRLHDPFNLCQMSKGNKSETRAKS